MFKQIATASLLALALTYSVFATPIQVHNSGFFESGSGQWGAPGDPFDVTISFDTAGFVPSGSTFVNPGFWIQDSYAGTATFAGTIGSHNFSWTGLSYIRIAQDLGSWADSFTITTEVAIPIDGIPIAWLESRFYDPFSPGTVLSGTDLGQLTQAHFNGMPYQTFSATGYDAGWNGGALSAAMWSGAVITATVPESGLVEALSLF